jgi:hypothetical protein
MWKKGVVVLVPEFGGTEENHENPQCSRCRCQNSNQPHLEYKSRALPLHQRVWLARIEQNILSDGALCNKLTGQM